MGNKYQFHILIFGVTVDKIPARAAHTTFLIGDKYYIYGGYTDDNDLFSDLWEITLADDVNGTIMTNLT